MKGSCSHPVSRALNLFVALNLVMPPHLPLPLLAAEALGRITVNGGEKSRSVVTNVNFMLRTNEALVSSETRIQRLSPPASLITNFLSTGESNLVRLTFPDEPGGRLPDGNYLASFVSERQPTSSNSLSTNT